MKKLKSTGRSFVMILSMFLAFMVFGAMSVSAQTWVDGDEALDRLRAEIQVLDAQFDAAATNEAKIEIAFKHKYYKSIMNAIIFNGSEVPSAVENSRPDNKPQMHSSGMIAFTGDGDTFKAEANTLVSEATDLLTD